MMWFETGCFELVLKMLENAVKILLQNRRKNIMGG